MSLGLGVEGLGLGLVGVQDLGIWVPLFWETTI